MTIEIFSPSTGQLFQTHQEIPEKEAFTIIEACHQAWLRWRETNFAERAEKMKKAADILRAHRNEYAELMANEMGKPINAGVKEIEKCAWVCEHYAEHAAAYLAPRDIKTDMQKSYVSYQPQGIVFAIMPWNFPFWQVFRFAAPGLMAGNAALLKHAPISTGSGLAIEKIFQQAGFEENLFRALVIDNQVASAVIHHRHVTAVTLTGSDRAGRIVGAEAADALKKVVLELGGSDPYLILHDADLEAAAEAIVASRMNNTGQVCIAAKRIFAVSTAREELERLITEKIDRYVMGDPLDVNTNFGPMAREDLRNEVAKQVNDSVAKGAALKKGGVIPKRDGFYYPPTILTNVTPGMPAYDDEIFGPVIIFIDCDDEQDAIKKANDTRFGLAAAVFTQDIERGEKIAREQLQAGACFVNSYVASDPRLPFGGIKESGYGRELSAEGIREFVNTKTIAVK